MGSIRIIRRGESVIMQDSDFYVGDQVKVLAEEVRRLRRALEDVLEALDELYYHLHRDPQQ